MTPSSFTFIADAKDEERKEPESPLVDKSEVVETKPNENGLQLIGEDSTKQKTETSEGKKTKKGRSRKQKGEVKEEGKPKVVPTAILTKQKPETVDLTDTSASPVPVEPVLSSVSPSKNRSKKEKKEREKASEGEKKVEEHPLDLTTTAAAVIEPTDSLLIQELKKLENNVVSRTERSVHQQVDKLYARIDFIKS